MNPVTTGFAPYASYGTTPYDPNATAASPSTLGNIASLVNQGQNAQNTATTNKAVQTAATKPKGSFLDRLLPTAGGVLGGLIGLPLNALDAVSGIGGTALDAGLAGAGAGLGKALENKLTGQNIGSGVLGNVALGAAGQGIGEGIGTLGSSLLGGAGSKATDMAGDFLQGQAAPGVLGKTDATELASLGANDLRQLPDIASKITGEDGALNQGVVKSLIKNGSPVNVDGLMSDNLGNGMANDLVNSESAIGKNAGNKILGTVNKSVQNMLGGTEGMVGNQEADPLDVLEQSRSLRSLASTAAQSAARSGNDEQAAVARVYNTLAGELENRTFNPNGVAVPLTDDVKSQIIDQLAPLKESSPKIYSKVVQQVTDAQNAQDLRPAQSLWVRASQAAQKTAANTDKGVGAQLENTVKRSTPLGLLAAGHPLSAIGSIATSSPMADRATSSILSQLGPALSTAGSSGVAPILGGAAGVATATSPNDIPPDQSGTMGSMLPSTSTGLGAANPLQNSVLSQVLNQDLTAGKESLVDPYLAGNYSTQISQLGSLLPLIQKVAAAQASAQQLQSLFEQAGGAQGPVGGFLSRLGQTFTGGPGSFVGSNLTRQEQQTAQALEGAGVPASSIRTPNLTQNQQSASAALSNISALVQALGGGQAPTQSPLLQATQ